MDKMRQFSFQDYNTSKQSEGNIDSINSTLSSCNNRNIEQRLVESRVLTSADNNIPVQNLTENLKVSPKKVLTVKQQKEGKENISSDLPNEKHKTLGQTNTNEQSAPMQQDPSAVFQEKWRNDFKENEIHLKENWKKMNKINKLLEEHKKKKANRKSGRNPLSNIDENAASNQPEPDLQDSPKIKGATFKGSNATSQEGQGVVEVYEERISYEYFEERPEQVFSAALHETFGGERKRSVKVNVLPPPESESVVIETVHVNFTQVQQEKAYQAPELEMQMKNNPIEFDKHRQSDASVYSKTSDIIEPKEKHKTSEKKVPIEERLRLKEIEREMKLTCLREERSRQLMTEMQDKPHISENSIKIAMNSRRVKENEEVLDKLTVSTSKKSALLGASKYSEASEHHNQSKMSNVRSNWDRSVQEHEKSIGLETDSNINLYKRNSQQGLTTQTSQHTHPLESHRHRLDTQDQLDTVRKTETAQKAAQPKETEYLDLTQAETGHSLHKQASDRLMQAMAKKATSQTSRISPLSKQEYLKSESSVPLSPLSHSRMSTTEKNSKGYPKDINYDQEIPSHHSIQTEQGSVGSFRTPKHIYLRMPNPLIIEKEGGQGHIRQEQHRHQTDEKNHRIYTAEDYDHIHDMHTHDKGDHIVETRKRSTRQPTFGGSPSRKPTNQSKLGDSQAMVTGGFNDKSVEKSADNFYENQSRTPTGRPTQESLIMSMKMRQQKFGESGSNFNNGHVHCHGFSQKQFYKRDITLEEEKPWPEIDVYMRNSMWLSAKNSKMAAMGRMKENREMKECTFQPHLQENKYHSNASTRSEFRMGPKMISERGQIQSKLGIQRKTTSSYKELHANKLRTFDQQQTISVTSAYVDQEFTEHDDGMPVDSVQQEGQKFVSL